jgi:hypothetical protein
MFKIIKSAIQSCRPGAGAATPSAANSWGLSPELQKALAEAKTRIEQERAQALADAHAAAASGDGPQPWERDWIEFQVDIEDEIREIADTIGWQRIQDFLEVLDWALASPQGQRALAAADDNTSPWQGALEMIDELRRPLIEASHQMIRTRADGLGYTGEASEELWDTLDELSLPLYNITRGDD